MGLPVGAVSAALSTNAIVTLIACALTGFTASMLWPGTLIAATPKFSKGGVAMFALLAAGGDLGGSIAPQLMGAITDQMINNPTCIEFSIANNLSIEMVAMRVSLLSMTVFPILLIIVSSIVFIINKRGNQQK